MSKAADDFEKSLQENLGAEDGDWEEVNPMNDEIHDFEQEDTLVGVYVGKQEDIGDNNSTLYTIEKRGGKKVGVWGSALLDGRFGGIFIGEEVKIVYLGKEKSQKSNRTYKNFAFYHRPQPKA